MSTESNKTRYLDTSSYLISNINQIFRIWWTIKITSKNCIRKSDQAKSQHSGIVYAFPSQIRSPALDLYLMCLFFCMSLLFSILLILCLVGLYVPILLQTYLSKLLLYICQYRIRNILRCMTVSTYKNSKI